MLGLVSIELGAIEPSIRIVQYRLRRIYWFVSSENASFITGLGFRSLWL
mgnify:CR=1 FL=1